MSKQELIDKYNTKKANLRPYCPNRNSITEQLKNDIYKEFIDDLKQLDEPQKSVVPKFVGEYFNYCIANERTLAEALSGLDKDFKVPDYLYPAIKWLEDSMNQDIFAQAWLFGYEVKKEPLYYVYFPEIIASPEMFFPDIKGSYLMKNDDGIELADNNDFDDMKFTEAEIKAIDERFWVFAVPVEEVAEG